MAISKVIYDGQTLIDLTADTVDADKLLKGHTAHSADGTIVEGTIVLPNLYFKTSDETLEIGTVNFVTVYEAEVGDDIAF